MINSLKTLLKRDSTWMVLKFLIVGVLSAIMEFSLLILVVEKTSIDYLIGNFIAFSITNVFTYLLSKKYVFTSSNANSLHEAALFIICLLGGLVVNQLVLWVLVEFTVLDYRLAKVVAIAVTVIWNYFTRKHFVFKNKRVVVEE